MNILDIINKKKNKGILSHEELSYAFNGYLDKSIPDYQMSSLLMAITINGMNLEETINLTEIFINSGDIYHFNYDVCDKHSTGGVGDTVTFIVGPIIAACGLKMAKMSGRGLGITGGTADKLESIPGYNINLTKEDYYKYVDEIGLAVGSQTGDLTPLDKEVYALRDVTGTTESIPLIASSIMSKKIACGAKYIVIDVKCGEGALLKTEADAKELSSWLIAIGSHFNREVKTIITPMDEPLSDAIGNAIEVMEAINVLNGEENELLKTSIDVASTLISMAKKISMMEAEKEVRDAINSKRALDKFYEWIKNQGGDISRVVISDKILKLKSNRDGVIEHVSAIKCGKLSIALGGGRIKKTDTIDYSVGIKLLKHKGDTVKKGDVLANIYVSDYGIKLSEEDLKLFIIK